MAGPGQGRVAAGFQQEFLADVRTWPGGIRQFLIDQDCDPETIEHVMADEPQ